MGGGLERDLVEFPSMFLNQRPFNHGNFNNYSTYHQPSVFLGSYTDPSSHTHIKVEEIGLP